MVDSYLSLWPLIRMTFGSHTSPIFPEVWFEAGAVEVIGDARGDIGEALVRLLEPEAKADDSEANMDKGELDKVGGEGTEAVPAQRLSSSRRSQ